MLREFLIIDVHGRVLAEGEQDGLIYRVFTADRGTLEFEDVSDMHAELGGIGIQMRLLPSGEPRQLTLFGGIDD